MFNNLRKWIWGLFFFDDVKEEQNTINNESKTKSSLDDVKEPDSLNIEKEQRRYDVFDKKMYSSRPTQKTSSQPLPDRSKLTRNDDDDTNFGVIGLTTSALFLSQTSNDDNISSINNNFSGGGGSFSGGGSDGDWGGNSSSSNDDISSSNDTCSSSDDTWSSD